MDCFNTWRIFVLMFHVFYIMNKKQGSILWLLSSNKRENQSPLFPQKVVFLERVVPILETTLEEG